MEPIVIIAATASLLVVPGPTNALLAMAGAELGRGRALPLLVAVVAGYGLAILGLKSLVGPAIAASPKVDLLLRAGVLTYLVILAAKLWRRGGEPRGTSAALSWQALFITTLFNPKSIIFAFAILPQALSVEDLAQWIGIFSVIAAAAGSGWIWLGATLRHGFETVVSAKLGYRISAIALLVIAGTVSAHAFV